LVEGAFGEFDIQTNPDGTAVKRRKRKKMQGIVIESLGTKKWTVRLANGEKKSCSSTQLKVIEEEFIKLTMEMSLTELSFNASHKNIFNHDEEHENTQHGSIVTVIEGQTSRQAIPLKVAFDTDDSTRLISGPSVPFDQVLNISHQQLDALLEEEPLRRTGWCL
jgi:hypothetical protein